MSNDGDATRNSRAGKPGTGEVYSYLLNPERVKEHVSPAAIEAARKIDLDLPDARDIVQTSRIFVRRATRWMVSHDINQIIDLGSGLPTDNNTHEVAHDWDPAVRVVYVDNDPVTAEQASSMAADIPNIAFLDHDICHQPSLWSRIEETGLVDFEQPIGLVMVSVIHLISEVECQQAAGISTHQLVRQYVDALPPGSYLAFAHLATDEANMEQLNRVLEYVHGVPRSKDEIRRYFDGTELVCPYRYEDEHQPPYDIIRSNLWQAKRPDHTNNAARWIHAGVGIKQ